MANKLFSLFEDKLRTPQDLVASPSQNLQSIGQQVEDPTAILRMIQQFEVVRPKADYSDFANFVFFNSALDYFNITGEKILNTYPYDASSADLQFWLNSLDEYQRYTVSVWPKSTGYLNFVPSNGFSYIQFDDVGKNDGITQTSFLSPSTSSFSLEFWVVPPPSLTGSDDIMMVFQKVSGTFGFSAFFTGSQLIFNVVSGSNSEAISAPTNPGVPTYFCMVRDCEVSPPVERMLTGSATSFPVLVSSLTSSISTVIDAGSARFYIGSGSALGSSKIVRPLTGALDEFRFWRAPRDLADLTSSFNTRITAQDNLTGIWRFNESGSLPAGQREIIRDSSGHRLNGRVINYYTSLRNSGSLLPFDSQDLALSLDEPTVLAYVQQQQLSGALYDRYNDNIINRLMPEQFFLLEEFKNTTVLRDFLYVIARYFDELKVMIDQFAYVLKNDYGRINNTPDALLQDIGKFFGWEFTGTFLNSDAIQYILGKQVLPNLEYNRAVDTKLYEIKNEFWKRTLINLMHLYKTKGTRESVETILRIYGANKNFIRLKEYGYKPNAGIQTYRVNSEKSTYALEIDGLQKVWNNAAESTFQNIELRVKFPTVDSTDLTASLATGSIFSYGDNVFADGHLFFMKTAATSMTGSLILTGTEGRVVLPDVPIFDNEWYNLTVRRDVTSGSLFLEVRHIDEDIIDYHVTSSYAVVPTVQNGFGFVQVGMSRDSLTGSQMWAQELRVWSQDLSDSEMDDHALNFQSYGTDESDGNPTLDVHWRLNDNVAVDGLGTNLEFAMNFAQRLNPSLTPWGRASGFTANSTPFTKFLFDYNYIASPEYGWNEEKVRHISGSSINPLEAFQDNPLVGLEFNLTDALNEDISQIISSLDGYNDFIGSPVDYYRDEYVDLETLRKNYFQRLGGSINFRVFADLLEFFDRSFIDMVKKLIPARATFLGDEFVVESHMLERPKVQWNYRRREPEFAPEGVIQIYIRS